MNATEIVTSERWRVPIVKSLWSQADYWNKTSIASVFWDALTFNTFRINLLYSWLSPDHGVSIKKSMHLYSTLLTEKAKDWARNTDHNELLKFRIYRSAGCREMPWKVQGNLVRAAKKHLESFSLSSVCWTRLLVCKTPRGSEDFNNSQKEIRESQPLTWTPERFLSTSDWPRTRDWPRCWKKEGFFKSHLFRKF